ncbi:hypothetical protein Cgig2_009093 [Carnegiea gigantea]|uniref:RNase H type-1 domain-containing protein n=1 Tax=Carnegiea gigantea TaxID=171969 RepID=A0A9Q1KEA9_9CARY|nr:hypothetical protein Cgig2_009093 [Carnegiea gigantea]
MESYLESAGTSKNESIVMAHKPWSINDERKENHKGLTTYSNCMLEGSDIILSRLTKASMTQIWRLPSGFIVMLTMAGRNSQWPIKFVTIVWWLWRWRNERCFGRASNIPSDKLRFLFERFQEAIKAISLETKWLSTASTTGREVTVDWEPPSAEWVALNMDGTSGNNPGPSGGGGVFHGWRGEWMGGFAERMGVYSSVRVELRAILQGLRLAREKGYRKLVVYVDSIVIVGMLNDYMKCSARHNALVQQCRRLLQLPD